MKNLSIALLAAFAFVSTAAAKPAGSKSLKDLSYVTDGHERQKLDLHLPPNPKGPLLVHIHGGAWWGGSKDHVDLRLLDHGYSVASLAYRFSQDAPFPAQIEDCKAAIRWLRANAEKYGYDPDRIAVTGESAGGHLAALVATTGDIRKFDVGENLDQSSAVRCGVNFYGPTDFPGWVPVSDEPMIQRDGPGSCVEKLFRGSIDEKEALAKDASPVTWVSKEDAPLYILHGTKDHLVSDTQSRLLAEKYKAAGVDVELDIIEGAGHGGAMFHLPKRTESIRLFLEKHLAPAS